MFHCPVKVISQVITVCATSNPDRFVVTVYMNGKWDERYHEDTLEGAIKYADAIADGDRNFFYKQGRESAKLINRFRTLGAFVRRIFGS